MEIKIENKIAIPSKPSKFPWAELKIGDSFLCPSGHESAFRSNVCVASKRLGIKLTVRKTPEGLRVWRVE